MERCIFHPQMCSPLTAYSKKLFGVVDQVTSKNIYLTLSRTFIRETLVTSFHKSSSSDVFSAGMHASCPLRKRRIGVLERNRREKRCRTNKWSFKTNLPSTRTRKWSSRQQTCRKTKGTYAPPSVTVFHLRHSLLCVVHFYFGC